MPPFLDARGIRKRFGGVLALDGVSVSIQSGEVLAIVGENGAGKSTLMKILAGIHTPDEGQLLLDGQPLRLSGPRDAMRVGISLIHQELNLAENLGVAANLFLGRERLRAGPLAWLDRRGMDDDARRLMDRVGLEESPSVRVGSLTPGQRQLVEIARALSLQARVIIMDEPTSSLTQKETDRLFTVIDDLRQSGVAVVYISHRLAEVQRLADRAVVLRDGRQAGELARAEITHDALVKLMVGRDLTQFHPREARNARGERGPVRLSVEGLRHADSSHEVSFQLHGGEIVGLAGLVGAGRTELAETLFGLRRRVAGQVRLDGQLVSLHSPRAAVEAGLLLVPEDRRHHGLLLDDSIQRNIGLPNLDQLSVLRLVSRRREAALARHWVDRLRVKAPGLAQAVGLLSGGNQQKIVLGKWLARSPKILICDEPTRGVDVGAKGEMYALLDRLAADGTAVLMISSDLEEVLGMSDRVLVLHEGRLSGELTREQLSEESVMRLATGGAR